MEPVLPKHLKHFPTVNGFLHPQILQTLLQQYPLLPAVCEKLRQLLDTHFPDGLPNEFGWAHLYRHHPLQLFPLLMQSMPQLPALMAQFAAKHDPNLAVARATDLSDVDGMVGDAVMMPPENKDVLMVRIAELHGMVRVLSRHLHSMAIHGDNMAVLLHHAEIHQRDDALFKALRLDPVIAQLPFVEQRYRQAETCKDEDFLSEYYSAQRYDREQRMAAFSSLDKLRLVCSVLNDWPGLNTKTTSEVMAYLRDDVGLDIYPGNDDTFRKHLNTLLR